MKYQIGDDILVLHSNEEGKVVDFINDKMVMIEVRGVKFPAYMDQIDFPYFKRFTQKKIVEDQKPLKQFIDNNWNEFNNTGQVTVPISGYVFEKDKLENMNPQKLFNYMLQNLESAMNVCILMDIHKLLRGRKTKIVLYTYDSFLFELGEGDENIEKEIKQILFIGMIKVILI